MNATWRSHRFVFVCIPIISLIASVATPFAVGAAGTDPKQKQLPAAKARSRAPTPEQIQLLLPGGAGTDAHIINPPVGNLDPQVKKTEAFFDAIIQRLLREKPFDGDVRIKIFFNEGKGFSVSSESGMEEEFWAKNGARYWQNGQPPAIDREWPIRRWLGVKNPHTPIYFTNISIESLRILQSEDQAAFFIARELTTIREDLYNPNHEKGEDLAKQVENLSADVEAMEWIHKAGYAPSEALSALGLLYPKPQADEKVYPVLAALRGDAHEGVRIAALQAQIEHLKRESLTNLVSQTTPIPDFLHLKKSERLHRSITAAEFEELRGLTRRVVREDFVNAVPSPYFNRITTNARSNAYARLDNLLYRASPDQNGRLLREGIAEIKTLTLSNQLKGNAAMRYLQMLNSNQFGQPPTEFFLTSTEAMQIARDMKSFTAGTDGWNSAEYLKIQSGASVAYLPGHFHGMRSATWNDNAQPIFKNLYDLDLEYRRYLDEMTEIPLRSGEKKTPLGALIASINTLDYSEGPLRDRLLEAAFSRVRKLDIAASTTSDEALRTLKELEDFVKNAKQPKIKEFAQPLVEQFRQGFQVYYETKMMKRFPEALGDLSKIPQEIEFLGDALEKIRVSPSFRREAKNYLIRVARAWTTDATAYPARHRSELRLYDGELPNLFSEILESQALPASDRTMVIDYLLSNKNGCEGFSLSKPETKRLTDAMRASLLDASPAKITEWMNRDTHAQYGSTLANMLSDAHHFPIRDISEPELDRLITALGNGSAGVMNTVKAKDFKTTRIDDQMDKWMATSEKYGGPIESMIEGGFARNTGILALIGSDAKAAERVSAKFTYADFLKLVLTAERQQARAKKLYDAGYGLLQTGGDGLLALDAKSGAFMLDIFEKVYSQAPSLEERWALLERIRTCSPIGIQEHWQTMDRIGVMLADDLNALPTPALREWLKKENLFSTVPQEKLAPLLRKSMPEEVTAGISNEKLGGAMTQLNQNFSLQEKYPKVYGNLRDQIAEEFKIQPEHSEQVFQDLTKTSGARVRFASEETRGLSGLVSLTRKQPIQAQIDMIEYLMGRQSTVPPFIFEGGRDTETISSLPEYVRETRTRLATAKTLERAMMTNAFLAGPNGFMSTDDGLKTMVEYLLKDISEKNKPTAYELAYALIRAEGQNRSLAVSYVLGQAAVEGSEGKLAEAKILKSLFEAYGVPGIKFGQYLAFTAELKDFREVLEELQDSAMPLSYLEAVRLCEERFGSNWPEKVEITGLKGSGSVNVALGFREIDTGREGVISILRDNIENTTRLDFERFRRFISELTKTPAGSTKYGYLQGLSSVIEASVRLEFDKVAAMKMQNFVIPMYAETHYGWKVRTIEAWRSENGANFTKLAPGKSARKILAKDPEAYRTAMMALAQVEMDRILGIGPDGSPWPVSLYANPDFHDGQVLIDIETRTVTILDFGQAVKLSNAERELGVDILRVISKADSAKSAARILNSNALLKKRGGQIGIGDLEKLFERTERMDIFIQLLSLLDQSKMPVPLASVHWILAVNRQIALGEKIGVDTTHIFRHLVITDKLGLPKAFYNALHMAKRAVCQTVFGNGWVPKKRWFGWF